MIKKLTTLIIIILMLVSCISLTACSGGISGNEAKALVNDFFMAIETDNYTAAEELLHPDHAGDLKAFFDSIKESKNVDFSEIIIEKYTGFTSVYYDSSVGGSLYGLSMRLSLSGRGADAKFELAKNHNGFGICNMQIKIDD